MPDDYSNLRIKEHHWSRILREVERGEIVPIIGPELLEIEENGERVLLYDFVARELAERLGIDTSGLKMSGDLCELVYRYRKEIGDHLDPDPYHVVYEILRSKEWTIPESLKKLAEISHFKLFVITTPDDLMLNALKIRAQSGWGEDPVKMHFFSPDTDLKDLPDAFDERKANHTTVFKLFGDVSMRPDFALTEEDTLRYVHHLQIRDERPANLFDILRERSLMMVGCSFDNWLIRFLLCSVKGVDACRTYGVRGMVADRNTHSDQPLLPFLSRNRTLLFPSGDAAKFIDELHGHWRKKFGESKPDAEDQNEDSDLNEDIVFISYASEDREAAMRVRDSLESYKIPVWFDQSKFEGGEVFEGVITEKIKECSMFLPIISKNTISPERRFFRLEWNLAIKEAQMRPESHPFIQPILIDETPFDAPNIPDEFRRRHFNRFPSGEMDKDFPKNLIRSLRRYQSRTVSY